MDLIIRLLKGLIEGLIWGGVFLILAAVLLPESLFMRLLKKIKPNIIDRGIVFGRLKTTFDYLLNKKEIVIEDSISKQIKYKTAEIASLIKEKTTLENNLFFLDLLKSLSAMTNFSIRRVGFDEVMVCNVIEQSMEYLQSYAKELQDTESFGKQRGKIMLSAERLRQRVEDTAKTLSTEEGEQSLQIAKYSLKQGMDEFDSYMSEEYDSTRVQLSRINQILADRLMEYVGYNI